MDNWDASVVYHVAIIEHQVRVARGEAAQRLATVQTRRPLRSRLATALVVLAARLAPSARPAHLPERSATRAPA